MGPNGTKCGSVWAETWSEEAESTLGPFGGPPETQKAHIGSKKNKLKNNEKEKTDAIFEFASFFIH